jgi:hypothetical protein
MRHEALWTDPASPFRNVKHLARVRSCISSEGLRMLSLMDLSQLNAQQLKDLVQGLVDDRIRELIGDPDLGLSLGDALRTRLKESLQSQERLSGEDVADKLGLRW